MNLKPHYVIHENTEVEDGPLMIWRCEATDGDRAEELFAHVQPNATVYWVAQCETEAEAWDDYWGPPE